MSTDTIQVETKCPECKAAKTLTVKLVGHERWKRGALIQDCDLGIAADDYENLISGTCVECWDELFNEEA